MKLYKLTFKITQDWSWHNVLRNWLPHEVWNIEESGWITYDLWVVDKDWDKFWNKYKTDFERLGVIEKMVEIPFTSTQLEILLTTAMNEMIKYGENDYEQAEKYIDYYVSEAFKILKEME